jgi:hypothetical protein
MINAADTIRIIPAHERNETQTGILKILAYFDIFQYPLTKSELSKFMGDPVPGTSLGRTLMQMTTTQEVFLHDGFYSLHNNPLLALKRKEGNHRAGKLLPRAFRIGRFLYGFPFVRAICISGSLSKNFADEKADIDFFIITKANRLWIARTIMHLFKKLTFVTGHEHYFCMNYYIDEEAILIEEQNIYTAVEIATLLPVRGKKTIENFFTANGWCARFFPACNYENIKPDTTGSRWIKRLAEWIFAPPYAGRLDSWLHRITTNRWQRKNEKGKCNKNGHTMRLINSKHFSRSNPGGFQERVLALYKKKLAELKLL